MLGKLLKHEFKATSRSIVLILAVLAIITPLTALYLRITTDSLVIENITILQLFAGICIVLYICAMVAVAVVTSIMLLYQFYKSMVGSQGYLTHTLPVKTSVLVFSKLIVAFIWQVLCIVAMGLSIALFTWILGAWKISDIQLSDIINILQIFGVNHIQIFSFLLLMVISIIVSYLQFYASFAIGQRMNGHPFLGAVISYIGISVVTQIISSIVMVVASITTQSAVINNINSISRYMNITLCWSILVQLVFGAILYFITVYMFKNKLSI